MRRYWVREPARRPMNMRSIGALRHAALVVCRAVGAGAAGTAVRRVEGRTAGLRSSISSTAKRSGSTWRWSSRTPDSRRADRARGANDERKADPRLPRHDRRSVGRRRSAGGDARVISGRSAGCAGAAPCSSTKGGWPPSCARSASRSRSWTNIGARRLRIVRFLTRFFRRHQIEVIHTHRYKDNILGSIAAALRRSPACDPHGPRLQ